MQNGARRFGAATVAIGDCKALPTAMRPLTREVRALQTPAESQGKGDATALMHRVCGEADADGLTLVLWPQPFGDAGLGKTQLSAWYARRFGFITLPGCELMARAPGSTPRYVAPVAAAVAAL